MTGPLQSAVEYLVALFNQAQDLLFAFGVQPLIHGLRLEGYMEDAYEAAGWILVGLLQIAAMLLVLWPLERLRPFERTPADRTARAERRHAIAVDVIYTLIDRLGLLRLLLFFSAGPVWDAVFGHLAAVGAEGWHLDQWIAPWWPGVTDTALAGFVAYAVSFDFVGYLLHRAQHSFQWWWALHAVHHSQRHLTMWSDSRNHLLDTVLLDSAFVIVARIIGPAPGQFVALVAVSKLVESLAHANFRLNLGWLGERLVVGPLYHRVHHGVGIGHESEGGRRLGGCNFAVLFPVWDLLFGTARHDVSVGATGIRDQLPEHGSREYGRGFWAQQRLGLVRLRFALWPAKQSRDA